MKLLIPGSLFTENKPHRGSKPLIGTILFLIRRHSKLQQLKTSLVVRRLGLTRWCRKAGNAVRADVPACVLDSVLVIIRVVYDMPHTFKV